MVRCLDAEGTNEQAFNLLQIAAKSPENVSIVFKDKSLPYTRSKEKDEMTVARILSMIGLLDRK